MSFLPLAAALLALAALAGGVYQLAAARQVTRFMAAPRPTPQRRPAVSLLKPLCGAEPGLRDNLSTACRQDYPKLQVVFGVADPSDPAAAVVESLVAENHTADLALVVDARRHGSNLKVGNLLNMFPAADGELVVIADSDVGAPPGYLDDVAAPFADPTVGLVTSLYVGVPAGGLWSRLGAMGINHGFLPSALIARALGRRDGCFGATMALRRDVLESVGGLERMRDVLADDWVLGAAVRSAGLSIALAARPVTLTVNEPDLRSLLSHEIRWGRTIAAVDRGSYIASAITQPVALALLAAAVGGWFYTPMVAIAALVRLVAIRTQERSLGLPRQPIALLVLREALNFVVFVTACCGRSVQWRGNRFRIRRDGTLELLEGIPS